MTQSPFPEDDDCPDLIPHLRQISDSSYGSVDFLTQDPSPDVWGTDCGNLFSPLELDDTLFSFGELESAVESVVEQNTKPVLPFPYECDICTEKFVENHDLQKHKQTHITTSRTGSASRVIPSREEESGIGKSDLVDSFTSTRISPRATDRSSKTTPKTPIDFSNFTHESIHESGGGKSINSVGIRLISNDSGTSSEPEAFVLDHTADFDEHSRSASPTPLNDQSSTATEDYIDNIGSQIINSTVFIVTRWLRSVFATAHQTTHGTEEASQSQSSQPVQSEQTHIFNRPKPSRKRKSDDKRNGSGDDDDNDGQGSLSNTRKEKTANSQNLPAHISSITQLNTRDGEFVLVRDGPISTESKSTSIDVIDNRVIDVDAAGNPSRTKKTILVIRELQSHVSYATKNPWKDLTQVKKINSDRGRKLRIA